MKNAPYGTAAPVAAEMSLSMERGSARRTALFLSTALLVLCVVCVTLQDPSDTQSFWQRILPHAGGRAPAAKARAGAANASPKSLNSVVRALHKQLDQEKLEERSVRRALSSSMRGGAAASARQGPRGSTDLSAPTKQEREIHMVPMSRETMNVVPRSLDGGLGRSKGKAQQGKRASWFLNW